MSNVELRGLVRFGDQCQGTRGVFKLTLPFFNVLREHTLFTKAALSVSAEPPGRLESVDALLDFNIRTSDKPRHGGYLTSIGVMLRQHSASLYTCTVMGTLIGHVKRLKGICQSINVRI